MLRTCTSKERQTVLKFSMVLLRGRFQKNNKSLVLS